MKKKVFLHLPYIGLSGLVISSFLLYLRVSFMETWFYCFAWWFFILIIDGINFRLNKSSLLKRSLKSFISIAVFSVSVWLVFELINLSLKNWVYLNLPDNIFERWAGYFIAFATVIPALIELADLFGYVLRNKKLAIFRIKITPFGLKFLFFLGIISLSLSILLSEYFFPLAWLCFIFLLEPINYKLQNLSLLREMAKGNWNRFWCWCMAGFAAGFIWEFLNFYAGAKWDYSIPYFDFARIFQMPLLGYFGFIPFALEIFAILQLFLYFSNKFKSKTALKYLIIFTGLIFDAVVFYLIDVYTSIPH